MNKKSARSILRRENLGFAAILVCVWLVEFLHVPHLLYGEPPVFNVMRGVFRTILIGAIWLWVHFHTRRLLRRLHELEEFLHVCSWCRKVGHEEQWLTMEEYFDSQLATETSHGICPECARRHLEGGGPMAVRVAPPS